MKALHASFASLHDAVAELERRVSTLHHLQVTSGSSLAALLAANAKATLRRRRMARAGAVFVAFCTTAATAALVVSAIALFAAVH